VALLFAACGGSVDLRTDTAGHGGSLSGVAGKASGAGAGTPSEVNGGNGSGEGGKGQAGRVAQAGRPGQAGDPALGAIGGAAQEAQAGQPSSGGADATFALSVLKSSGCGKELPMQQVPSIPGSRTGYTEWHVTQTGATLGADEPSLAGDRQFFVRVPFDYDPLRAYRVVYIGQGCGTQHAGKTNTYPLFSEAQGGSEQAVYVGLSVPDNAANPGCYDNNNGPESQEWEAFDLIHTFVEKTYCVDNNRIYVAGYSTGAWVANMWGCYFAGTPSPPLDEPDVSAGRMQRKFAPHWAIRGHCCQATNPSRVTAPRRASGFTTRRT